MLHLVIPVRADVERDAVAAVWAERGGRVTRLDRFWSPPPLPREAVRLYGPDVFSMLVAQRLDLALVSPADDLIVSVPRPLLLRTVEPVTLAEALAAGRAPWFYKSMVPKQLAARVVPTINALRAATEGLEPSTVLLASEPVRFAWEARVFVLRGQILDTAVYEGHAEGDLQAVLAGFVADLAAAVELPETCVVDVGYIPGEGLALVEFNASWGAGLNGCRPERVVDAIAAATRLF